MFSSWGIHGYIRNLLGCVRDAASSDVSMFGQKNSSQYSETVMLWMQILSTRRRRNFFLIRSRHGIQGMSNAIKEAWCCWCGNCSGSISSWSHVFAFMRIGNCLIKGIDQLFTFSWTEVQGTLLERLDRIRFQWSHAQKRGSLSKNQKKREKDEPTRKVHWSCHSVE